MRQVVSMMLALAVMVTLIGCRSARPPRKADMVGRYMVEYKPGGGDKAAGSGVEVLILRRNGTYEQTYVPEDRPLVRNEGRWSLIGTRALKLNNALHITMDTKGSESARKSDEQLSVSVSDDTITLVTESKPTLSYRKVP